MRLTSDHRTLPRGSAGHQIRMIWIGLSFTVVAFLPMFARDLPADWSEFCGGAAGAAFVVFAHSESLSWRRPLTLGHQLVFWWLWPLVLPFFALLTRHRRSRWLTILLGIPTLLILVPVVVDVVRILP